MLLACDMLVILEEDCLRSCHIPSYSLLINVLFLVQQVALERYNKMKGNAPERLVSGSDDFTMFLWEPAVSKHPKTRMTGHQQVSLRQFASLFINYMFKLMLSPLISFTKVVLFCLVGWLLSTALYCPVLLSPFSLVCCSLLDAEGFCCCSVFLSVVLVEEQFSIFELCPLNSFIGSAYSIVVLIIDLLILPLKR